MRAHNGQGVIQVIGLLFLFLITGAFAVDTGYYYAVHRGEQNAADAAALAGVQALFKDTTGNTATQQTAARTAAQAVSQLNMGNRLNAADIDFGYVDPATGSYNSTTFNNQAPNTLFAATGNYNAVRVRVKAGPGQANSSIPALFMTFMGQSRFTSQAEAVAIYNGGLSAAGGLRPVYMCQAAWNAAVATGSPYSQTITFYSDTLQVGTQNVNAGSSCGNLGPGNYGFADFTNQPGSPGSSTVQSWFENGYNGQISIGQTYEPQPGNEINTYSTQLNNLITAGTVITVPLYQTTSGSGSNAQFVVSGIAGFVITEVRTTGSSRYIRGHFARAVCTQQCTYGGTTGTGVTAIRLVN